MGYRNDVRICMKEENYYTLIERARKEGLAELNYLLDENSMETKHYEDGTVVFGWDWIKWEDDFEDVWFVMNFLDEMATEGYPYAFVRLGEDMGDTEEIFSDGDDGEDYSCHKIGITREIFVEPDKTA